MSIRDAVSAADDISTVPFEVEEWGVTIYLMSPTLAERSTLVRRFSKGVNEDTGEVDLDFEAMTLHLVCAVCHEQNGTPAFTEDDHAMLREKNGAVVNRVFEEGMKLAGFSKNDDGDDEKDGPTTDVEQGKDG